MNLKDLNKNTDIIADQSYSERQLFEKAYERILSEINNKKNVSQTLIFPINLSFSNIDFQVLFKLKDILSHLGFIFEKFNANEIEITGVHPVFNCNMVNDFFNELGDAINNFDGTPVKSDPDYTDLYDGIKDGMDLLNNVEEVLKDSPKDENGNIKEIRFYKKGKKTGLYRGFYKNGFLLAPACSKWVANEIKNYLS